MKSVGDMMRHVVGLWPCSKVDQSLYSQLRPPSDLRVQSNSVCYSVHADSLKQAARARRQKLTRHSVKLQSNTSSLQSGESNIIAGCLVLDRPVIYITGYMTHGS